MQIQTNSGCSGASLDSQQSKMSFILCLTRAALCVEPGSSLLCLDRDAAGQHSHFFPFLSLPALPQPAQHQPSGWLQGSPVLPGTSWHMEARFCSSLSSQHRPGHGFYCGQGSWESVMAKADEGWQMRLQLRHQNLGCWKPPPQQQYFILKSIWIWL